MRRIWLCVWLCGAAARLAPAGELEDARARIEQLRMGDLRIKVVDGDGKPVPGVELTVRPMKASVRFGCNLFQWDRCDSPEHQEAYRTRFASLFDFATLPFYWSSYEPEPGQTQQQRLDDMARWCHLQGIAPKGHPLMWNAVDPPWLKGEPDAVRRLNLERVDTCIRHFGPNAPAAEGDIHIGMWDVVNEPCEFERLAEQCPASTAAWQATGRTIMTRAGFVRAHMTDPQALLLINDYVTDERYEQLIESLRETDGSLPFGAIGIQAHMHRGVWSSGKIRDVCQRFGRFGLPLHITELTVLSGEPGWERAAPWPSTPEGEAAQAREVERIYTEFVAQPAVAAITWWDLSDQGAWQGAPAGLLRADMTPKPAYTVLERLIQKDWGGRVEGKTDAAGRFEHRVMQGERWVTYRAGSVRGGCYVTVGPKTPEPLVITVRQP